MKASGLIWEYNFRDRSDEQKRVANNTMTTVMGDLLLNPVGENMYKNHSRERRKEKHLSISASSVGQRWPFMMLNLLLDCDIGGRIPE